MIKRTPLVGAAAVLIMSLPSGIAIDISLSTQAGAALPGTAMALQEFVNDGAGGRAWNAYDQSQAAGGPAIAGRPSPVIDGNTIEVYVRTVSGDLVEFANDGAGGRAWNAYDIKTVSNGPPIAGDPYAVLVNGTIDVFAEAYNGELVEFANDGAGGRAWNAYDITAISGGATIGGDPMAIASASSTDVYVRAASGDLIEYQSSGNQAWTVTDLTHAAGGPALEGDPGAAVIGTTAYVYAQAQGGDLTEFANDGPGNSWVATDLSANSSGPTVTGRPSPVVSASVIDVYARGASGDLVQFQRSVGSALWSATDLSVSTNGPQIGGDPGAVVAGTSIDVYTESTSGDLTEFVNDGAYGRLWNSYDLTQDAGAGVSVGADPSPLVNGASVQVYVAGPQPAAPPGGVGLYGLLPDTQTPQAIADGWPIMGDTGALGTTTAPYTGFNLNNADLQTGLDIAASGKRVTWLSFWTVSGPVASGPGGSACYTSDCYYAGSYAAGQWVATTIDGYSSSGLNLKPDWVILDPEGYPDNHSGLDSGPGATAANWTSFLTGWANGLVSVDPSLHPAFYSDQLEYNTFDLSAIQLPAFIALEFPNPINILDNNDNVAGYVAAGATCPANSEEQTLVGPGWYGNYNTLEFVTGYCPP